MQSKAPLANCDACPLKLSGFVPPDPYNPDAQYTIVGESPGRDEVRLGKAFVGESGKLLWGVLNRMSVDRSMCNVTNAVLCIPPNTNKEEVLEAAAVCCRPRLMAEVADAKRMLLLGKTARTSFTDPEEEDVSDPRSMLGRWIKNFVATWHPAYVLREPEQFRTMFEDIAKFVRGKPYGFKYPEVWYISHPSELLGIKHDGVIAYDLETDQVNYREDDILMMVIAVPGVSYIVPGRHPGAQDVLYSTFKDPAWSEFWNQDVEFVGHNAKFDMRFLKYQFKWNVRCTFDTMLAHRVLDERQKTYALKPLAAKYFDLPDYEAGTKQYIKNRNRSRYSSIPFDVLVPYAAMDGAVTLQLYHTLAPKLKAYPVFHDVLMPLQTMFRDVEIRGFKVDEDYAYKLERDLNQTLNQLSTEISEMSGGEIENVGSPMQVAHYLYDVAKLPAPKGRKVKLRSTSKDVLPQLKGMHPIIDKLQYYRKVEKMRSSYVSNLIPMLDHESTVHMDVQEAGAETGRLAVKDPALQTVPRAALDFDGIGKKVKDMYVAREGRVLVISDYSQAELRVAAALSGDPFLIDVYNNDRDLHSEVAKRMYGPNYTKEQRVWCKMFNFSYLYGGTEHSFAESAGLPVSVAVEFVREYDRVMPVLAQWKKDQFKEMMTKGYVTTRLGRRRRVPFINYANADEARKASFNSPTQGSASDLTSLSAIDIYLPHIRMYDSYVQLLVHDSIISECPFDMKEEVARATTARMEFVGSKVFPEVKWKAEADWGYRWGTTSPIS